MMKMPENIKPISELRTYTKLLDEVKPDNPIVLTKNGYGKFIIADLNEYELMQKKAAAVELIQMMEKARQGKEYSLEDIKKEFLGE
ncbi:type II toxin-antitoxin system prevent-host-death family antitoxin [Levilactobacillus parabrevis]|uniref:type II toxin-antitoxin system prevent-host-death family antitoxin n=1 Tax=Levilactobacillus parabrevis TaxID=357278 RepID=UPI0021A6B3DD|nr:type II toxin-antitoxin system prevent-host-death family antitoxin [Levilactobacillus parabrevis]MCT4486648.1 type II toxin-antitoxin system Phd/YefM family antitoxin [Levilactobacillus parabrevis]MCT4489144.1 type II toxin-antitoxin system Phd/YefM family antitoxin [Levilactobacillus parabrevis]